MRKAMLGAGMAAMLLAGVALVVGAQSPPPPGPFDGRGPGLGGPMTGMFEFGGLMGGFGGKVVTEKPILATFTITHTETLPGNTISNTTTGTFARGADGSTYRDHERYDLIISNQVVQNFDRTMLRRYLANARGMMHSKSVLVHAAVPWKQRRRAFYTGACLAGTRRRRVKGALVMLKARVTPDALGYWYDLSDFEALARETGMAVTFFGCMAYLYRFHVVMSLAEARE